MKKVILVSGPPGCERTDYVEKALKGADNTVFYHVFKYIQEVGKGEGFEITEINVSSFSRELPDLRKRAFEKIKQEIERSNERYHIVSTPAVFYHSDWGKEEGLTEDLFNLLKPNVVIAFIDDLVEMKKRLKHDERWRLEFGERGPTLQFLAKWRQDSIELLQNMYIKYAKEFVDIFYIFAKQHPKNTFYDLIYREDKPKIYLSYPITRAREKIDRVERFRDKLSEDFVVFDPYTIRDWDIVIEYDEAKKDKKDSIEVSSETIKLHEVEEAISSIRTQLVIRDLSIIDSVDAVVVYHHAEEPSAGVVAEIVHAYNTLKPIFGIYPHFSRPSPFLEYFIKWGHIPTLYTPEKLVEFLEESPTIEVVLEKLEQHLLSELKSRKKHFPRKIRS